jgi:hypothetical protein
MTGTPAKNDCSTEVLLDFCTRVTFLQGVPAVVATQNTIELMDLASAVSKMAFQVR